jgi:hypothetical protein
VETSCGLTVNYDKVIRWTRYHRSISDEQCLCCVVCVHLSAFVPVGCVGVLSYPQLPSMLKGNPATELNIPIGRRSILRIKLVSMGDELVGKSSLLKRSALTQDTTLESLISLLDSGEVSQLPRGCHTNLVLMVISCSRWVQQQDRVKLGFHMQLLRRRISKTVHPNCWHRLWCQDC